MRLTFVALLLIFSIEQSLSQTLSEQERRFVVDLLEDNEQKFLSAIEKINEHQWSRKSVDTAWVAKDIAEHIVVAESFLISIVRNIVATKQNPEKASAVLGREQAIILRALDRSERSQAPESILPMSRFRSKDEMASAFRSARQATIAYVKTVDQPLKAYVATHPFTGDMSAYQWLVWIAAHSDRHLLQLEELLK